MFFCFFFKSFFLRHAEWGFWAGTEEVYLGVWGDSFWCRAILGDSIMLRVMNRESRFVCIEGGRESEEAIISIHTELLLKNFWDYIYMELRWQTEGVEIFLCYHRDGISCFQQLVFNCYRLYGRLKIKPNSLLLIYGEERSNNSPSESGLALVICLTNGQSKSVFLELLCLDCNKPCSFHLGLLVSGALICHMKISTTLRLPVRDMLW